MMNPLMKGIGSLAMIVLATPWTFAQEALVKMQSYTSKISITTCDNLTVIQQVGFPLGTPVKVEGEPVVNQGLFGVLTGLDPTTSGVDDIIYSYDDGILLSFDPVLNTLNVNTSTDSGLVRIAVMDTAGNTILAISVDNLENSVHLPQLAPGTYIAAVATLNNLFKSFKFIVK